jgi:ParB family chromosome partitioning protein
MARAGAFVSIDQSGALRIERGFVRPEDEAPVAEDSATDEDSDACGIDEADDSHEAGGTDSDDDEEIDDRRQLPDRLVAELSAHRTLALRDALSLSPGLAFLAALHALTLRLFYSYGLDSCLELAPKWVTPAIQPPGLAETPAAQDIDRRHTVWASGLPERPEDLWAALQALDAVDQQRLFAHCVALTVNAIAEPYAKRPRALKHAHQLAQCLGLDMARAGWRPTADSYLARVTKAQICDAVREACGEDHAARIADLKKPDMVAAAEQLLEGTGWLPEPLRTVGQTCAVLTDDITGDDVMAHDHSVAVQSAEIGCEPAIDANADPEDDDSARYVPTTIAAE